MNLKTLTREQVERLADTDLIFQRGQAYLAAGAVTSFKYHASEGCLEAKVAGSNDFYRVEICQSNTDLNIDCSCPYDGEVCKHAIAVLLYFLNRQTTGSSVAAAQGQVASPPSVLGQVLEKMEPTRLVALLVELSEQNDTFRRTLMENITIPPQIVQQQPVNATGVRRLKSEITRYFKRLPATLDEYYESEELDEIDDFFDEIATFNPKDQLELLDHLVAAGNAVLDDYGINAVQLGRALSYYGQAASLLPLSSLEKQDYFSYLLASLEKLEIWDYGADRRDLKAGLDALATTKDDYSYLLKPLAGLDGHSATPAATLNNWIADYYRKLGDEKNYLAIREANLITEADYLELADYWHGKGNGKEYLATLEGWLVKLAEDKAQHRSVPFVLAALQATGKIFERLVEHYAAQGDDQNLLRVLLVQAEHRGANLALYRRVKEVAGRLARWPTVRQQFLGLISSYNNETLAEIYLYEKDWTAALELARQQTGYGQETVKAMVAEAVQPDQSEAAIELYASLVEYNIGRANRKYYQVAARYAAHIKEIYQQILKNSQSWQDYVGRIRSANNRRSALLDEFKGL